MFISIGFRGLTFGEFSSNQVVDFSYDQPVDHSFHTLFDRNRDKILATADDSIRSKIEAMDADQLTVGQIGALCDIIQNLRKQKSEHTIDEATTSQDREIQSADLALEFIRRVAEKNSVGVWDVEHLLTYYIPKTLKPYNYHLDMSYIDMKNIMGYDSILHRPVSDLIISDSTAGKVIDVLLSNAQFINTMINNGSSWIDITGVGSPKSIVWEIILERNNAIILPRLKVLAEKIKSEKVFPTLLRTTAKKIRNTSNVEKLNGLYPWLYNLMIQSEMFEDRFRIFIENEIKKLDVHISGTNVREFYKRELNGIRKKFIEMKDIIG